MLSNNRLVDYFSQNSDVNIGDVITEGIHTGPFKGSVTSWKVTTIHYGHGSTGDASCLFDIKGPTSTFGRASICNILYCPSISIRRKMIDPDTILVSVLRNFSSPTWSWLLVLPALIPWITLDIRSFILERNSQQSAHFFDNYFSGIESDDESESSTETDSSY